MKFRAYTFQESLIWEGSGDVVDESRTPVRITAKSEDRARKQLPKTSVGRHWVLLRVEEKNNP